MERLPFEARDVWASVSIFVSSIPGIRPLFSIRRVGRVSCVQEGHQDLDM